MKTKNEEEKEEKPFIQEENNCTHKEIKRTYWKLFLIVSGLLGLLVIYLTVAHNNNALQSRNGTKTYKCNIDHN